MRLIPIIALVTEDQFHAFNDLLSMKPPPEPGPIFQQVMDANGWTVEQIIAGTFFAFGLEASEAKAKR